MRDALSVSLREKSIHPTNHNLDPVEREREREYSKILILKD